MCSVVNTDQEHSTAVLKPNTDSGWEKSISAKSYIQNSSKKKKSLGRTLVKKSENIITYSTPAVSHARSVFNLFMAFVLHHSCQCLMHVMLVAHLRDRGVTSHFSEGEQRPRVVVTCQLSTTAFHKQFAKVSRYKSYTGNSCIKSEQSPSACTRSHILPHLPVATSGVNTVRCDLPWSQRTSMIEKKPKPIIKFGLQELNHLYLSYHSRLHKSSTSMSGNVTHSPVGLPLTSPPVPGPMIL